ncbi:hypothetical protein BGW41_007674 [Actinomortierella wolfii]|nr:hypothetical protein BGW41_007674 [Actinomortierella wolfii]
MTHILMSGVTLDINGSNGKAGVIRRGLEYDSKASSDAKLKYFAKVFKDPPNANYILSGRTEVVKDYQAYLELKPLLTGGMTLSSKCADLAHEIFDVHNRMRMRENRQHAAKSDTRADLVAQEEATTRRTIYAMLGGRSTGRHNLSATIPQPEETETDTDEQTMERAEEEAADTVDENIRDAAHAHEARTTSVVAVPHRLDREMSSTSESTDAGPMSPYPMSHPRPSVRGSRKRPASAMRHQPFDLLVSRVNSMEETLRDIQECIKKLSLTLTSCQLLQQPIVGGLRL